MGLAREDFSRAVRWLTGFAFLRDPNARINGDEAEEDDRCRLCAQAPEKADHVLRECPALQQLRWECFGAYHLDPGMAWEVAAVIKFLADPRVSSLEDSDDVDGDPPMVDPPQRRGRSTLMTEQQDG